MDVYHHSHDHYVLLKKTFPEPLSSHPLLPRDSRAKPKEVQGWQHSPWATWSCQPQTALPISETRWGSAPGQTRAQGGLWDVMSVVGPPRGTGSPSPDRGWGSGGDLKSGLELSPHGPPREPHFDSPLNSAFSTIARAHFLRDKADHVSPLLKIFHSNRGKLLGKQWDRKW